LKYTKQKPNEKHGKEGNLATAFIAYTSEYLKTAPTGASEVNFDDMYYDPFEA